MPMRCATCPTTTGAMPPPNSSPTAITTPDAVAMSCGGTDSEQSGPTVSVMSALLKKCTMNSNANSTGTCVPALASSHSEASAPTVESTMTGLRPIPSDNQGSASVPTVEPMPMADMMPLI